MRIAYTLAALLAAILVACGGDSEPEPTATATATSEPESVRVEGTFTLPDKTTAVSKGDPAPRIGATCVGTRGFDDIRAGMEVRLSSDGTTLDVARFGNGEMARVTERPYQSPEMQRAQLVEYDTPCEFTFELEVPPGYEFYTVTIGRRGERTYSYDEITTPGRLAFELTSP